MFKRNTIPQRKSLTFSKKDIIEDIEAIRQCEDQRNKLFLCLDEKPPQEHRFSQLEEFLKGTNNLEDISKILTDLVQEVSLLQKEISDNIDDLKNKACFVNTSPELKSN